MDSYSGYPNRQQYSQYPNHYNQRSAYDQDYAEEQQYQQPYAQNAYPQRSYSYHGHDRHQYPYDRRYSDVDQYHSDGRTRVYYPSRHSRHHRRHSDVIIGSTHNLGRYTNVSYAPTSSSSRYYAQGSRGQYVPVVDGRSRYHDWIPFSTRILRLFGLGPKHRSGNGVTVHVKRGSDDRYITSSDRRRHRIFTV